MSLLGRLLCALYSLTSLWLAWCAVRLYQYGGSPWTVPLFVAASIVPVVAVLRETVLTDGRHVAAVPLQGGRRHVRRDELCEAIACAELDAACCERWWTSLATDHDPTCPNQRRRNAA